jgi:phosphoadenosine phosphosulfate reductase
MALIEDVIGHNGIVTRDKVKTAIDLLKYYEPMALELNPLGYYLCYSGGKDSDVILRLAIMAGVKFEANYNITGIDPKECILHIKEVRKELKEKGYVLNMNPPKKFSTGKFIGQYKNMWKLIIHKGMPPTRLVRYCCSDLKEHGGEGMLCLTGIRWSESNSRSNRKHMEVVTKKADDKKLFNDNDEGRRQFENCIQKGKRVVNIIISWTDEDVWEFLKQGNEGNQFPYCNLYDNGYSRIGCVGCPMAGNKREKEFDDNPHIRKQYLKAFDLMLKQRREMGKQTEWGTGEQVMKWWLSQ